MDIREEKNLFQLLIASFSLVNRSISTLLAFVGLIVLLLLAKFLLERFVPAVLLSLLSSFVSYYISMVLIRILGTKAENAGETLSNSFSASVFPAIYALLSAFILGILGALVMLVAALSGSVVVAGLIGLILFGFLWVRLMYAPFAIALREQGPVSCLKYSWELTSGSRYFTALAAALISAFVPTIFVLAGFAAFYYGIPLFFADSFSFTSPLWIAVLLVPAISFVFFYLVSFAFLILVFLNQDYGFNRGSFGNIPSTPIEAQAAIAQQQQEQAIDAALLNAIPDAAVQVTHASVQSTEADHPEITEHLDKVFTPKKEDLMPYTQEEDRMPTILFDDDMAKAIEENQKLWAKKEKNEQPREDEGGSIKMSK